MGRYDQLLTPSKHPEQKPADAIQEEKSSEEVTTDNMEKPSVHARTLERDNARTHPSVNATTLSQKSYRTLSQQSGISLYKDQQDFLSRYSLEAKLKGKKIGVSQMIRDAIDTYIEILKKEQSS